MSLLEVIAACQPCYVRKNAPPIIEWGAPIPISHKMYSFIFKYITATPVTNKDVEDYVKNIYVFYVDDPDQLYAITKDEYTKAVSGALATSLHREVCTLCKVVDSCPVAEANFLNGLNIEKLNLVFNPVETGATYYLHLKHLAVLVDNLISKIESRVKAGEKSPVTEGLLATIHAKRRVYTKAGEKYLKTCNDALAHDHLEYSYKPLSRMTQEASKQLLDAGLMEVTQFTKVQVGYEAHPQNQLNTPDVTIYTIEG